MKPPSDGPRKFFLEAGAFGGGEFPEVLASQAAFVAQLPANHVAKAPDAWMALPFFWDSKAKQMQSIRLNLQAECSTDAGQANA